MTKMNVFELAQKLSGLNTIKMIELALKVNRVRAIYLVHRLRMNGFVRTSYQSDKTRVYYISPEQAIGGTSYLDIINKYSPIKLTSSQVHMIYGREPSIEETLIYAVTRRSVRYIIACLGLFRKIRDWSEMYRLAKEKDLVREIVVLYDVARLVIPKLRRMPKRFRTIATPKKTSKYKYIIQGFDSVDFKGIENKWKVYIPLNISDISGYQGRFS